MKGKGLEYLEYSFQMLYKQTFKDFEVIISDHSITDSIENLCKKWQEFLNIVYVRNKNNRGSSSSNINNAIKNATGEIIKILFQDDFLYDEESLYKQIKNFNGGWLVTSCCHYKNNQFYKNFYPTYNNNIHYGDNTISSPSVLMFENKEVLEFDENLIWFMDVDYYKRLYNKFGLPYICNDITVVNREHEYQVTKIIITNEIINKELNYIKQKYENIH